MEIGIDPSVGKVLEFMERNVEADRLVRVAAAIAAIAPVLWSDVVPLGRNPALFLSPESSRGQRSTATQLHPVRECASDGSEGVEGSQ